MFSKKLIKRLAIFASSAIFSLSTIQSAYAAPGTLATAPLFLSSIVEPNVFLTLDDSGSMDWGPMVAEGTGDDSVTLTGGFTTAGGLPWVGASGCTPGCDERRGHYTPGFAGTRSVLPPADGTDSEWDKTWIVRNHIGNRNYYNPSVNYGPWVGTQSDGFTPMYIDAVETAALKDAENPGGPSVDLTAMQTFTDDGLTSTTMWIPTYFTWTDDGDGVIELTDTHTEVTIAAGTPEMQNFANWFQYYRKRMDGTKRIIGGAINTTDASRMGLRWFNDGHRLDVETMSDPAKKRDLLEELYELDPGGGTPARNALKSTGQYFDNTGGSAPILSAALGGECQQNFNILMSDGFWNGSDPSGIGNRDNDGGSGGDNSIFDGDASQSNDGGNYADNFQRTLADVAMMDYERDLRGDLANNVPTQPGIDEADHQHLVTYTIAFGLTGTLDPLVDDPLAVGFTWPEPVRNTPTTIDDMWHAAYNARGKYLSAQNPGQLQASLSAALTNIAERTATSSAVAFSSAKLTTDTTVYLAEFNTNRWQGDLFAFKIDPLTGDLAATADWSAGSELLSRNLTANPREIITHDGTNGVPFRWANLSTAQKDDLKTNPVGGVDADAVGMARLDYLRGDRSDEGIGNFFRERLSILGDLVNSGPVYVGAPALGWPDTAPFPDTSGSLYSEFKNGSAASRDGMVYAAANDGMLHAFAETDGVERMAYIPNMIFSSGTSQGMHYLTDQNYGHKYYNDLTPSVSDVYADLGAGTKWQTILIGGLRGGERGIYALNVNNPSAFDESNATDLVLWEFTSNDDVDLGFTYSQPQIAMANNGQWVAIFGNGYNDTGDGEAKLFILDIEAGVDGAWTAGDYKVITTGSGTAADRNGLATPRLADIDGDGDVDRVYAGDLKGQMWAFDMSDTSSSLWSIPGGTVPLFTTVGGLPITSKPVLAKHPTESDSGTNYPNVMVFFGSGQYLTNGDKSTTDVNHFYGVWDKGDDGLDVATNNFVRQNYDNSFNPFRVLTNNPVNYAGGDYGWYFDLRDSGERSVVAPAVRGDLVFFNTFVPETDPCSSGGFGWRMAVDIVTGGSPLEAASDVNGDGVIDASDVANNGSTDAFVAGSREDGFLSDDAYIEQFAYASDKKKLVKEYPNIPTGRFGWQELIQ